MKRSKKFRRIKWALKNSSGKKKKRLDNLFEKLFKLSTLLWTSSHKEDDTDNEAIESDDKAIESDDEAIESDDEAIESDDEVIESDEEKNRRESKETALHIELNVITGTKTTSTNYYDANSYMYTRNNTYNNTIYLVCKNSVGCNCSARAIIRNNDLNRTVLVRGHNHEGEKKAVEKIIFNRTLQRICRKNPTLSPLMCYKKAKDKLKGKVQRRNIPMLSSFFQLIYRSQKKKVPLLPKNIAELESLIAEAKNHKRYAFDDAGKLFYRGIWEGETGKNVAFVSERTLQRVSEEGEVALLMDGTFRAIPSHLAFRQLYIINVIIKGRCFPLAYILMEKKDYLSYMTVFTELKKLIPSLNVVECMSDYESATRKAILKQFPGVKVSGCYFHFVQAINKKCKRFGLMEDDKFKSAVNKVAVLALLPNNVIAQGFDYISESVPESARWNRFRTYFQNQWEVANISVYGLVNRTNNFCETLNRNINKLIGGKGPNIWKLILTLQTVEMLKSDELEQVDGLLPNTRPTQKTISFNKKVKKATKRFKKSGDYKEFIDFMTFNDDLAKVFNINKTDLENLNENEEDESEGVIIPNFYNEVTEFRKSHPRTVSMKRKRSSEPSSIGSKKKRKRFC